MDCLIYHLFFHAKIKNSYILDCNNKISLMETKTIQISADTQSLLLLDHFMHLIIFLKVSLKGESMPMFMFLAKEGHACTLHWT